MLQVATIAVLADELRTLERYVRSCRAIRHAASSRAKIVARLAQTYETAVGLHVVLIVGVADNEIGVVVDIAGYALQPLVGSRSARSVEHNNPLVVSRLYAERSRELGLAHEKRTLGNVRCVQVLVVCIFAQHSLKVEVSLFAYNDNFKTRSIVLVEQERQMLVESFHIVL